MGRWLRVWFALLALFGPPALVPEAQARPVAVSVGGSQPEEAQRWARARRASADPVVEAAPAVTASADRASPRPLYLLNRALLH